MEKASDALSINGFEHYQANDYALEACYLPSNSWHTHRIKSAEPCRDFTKWWQDGDEPQYYLVSPKVHPQAFNKISPNGSCATSRQLALCIIMTTPKVNSFALQLPTH